MAIDTRHREFLDAIYKYENCDTLEKKQEYLIKIRDCYNMGPASEETISWLEGKVVEEGILICSKKRR